MPTPLRLLVLVALAALLSPVAALATPPLVETWPTDDETFLYPAGSAENPCAFDLTYRNTGTFVVTTYFDSSGAPTRIVARSSPGHFVETYSANGKELTARSTAVVHLDLETFIGVGTGNQRHFVVPGGGIVLAQAGRFVIDFSSGDTISATGLDVPQGAEFCAALAP